MNFRNRHGPWHMREGRAGLGRTERNPPGPPRKEPPQTAPVDPLVLSVPDFPSSRTQRRRPDPMDGNQGTSHRPVTVTQLPFARRGPPGAQFRRSRNEKTSVGRRPDHRPHHRPDRALHPASCALGLERPGLPELAHTTPLTWWMRTPMPPIPMEAGSPRRSSTKPFPFT